MCDTMVALGKATADGSVILAKNSDREPNEAHVLEWQPRAVHDKGERVRCTYITMPQVRDTYEVLLCRPFWLWGCEMGANEKGVTIGNEAVFTRGPYAATGLLGMDLMRLALERAGTAEAALQVITDLIAEHGQGGACGYRNKKLQYHNAFIIADPASAWVLETAGKQWVAARVRDVYTISNRLTIGEDYDLCSSAAAEHARARGWLAQGEALHFARCYSDRLYNGMSRARTRRTRSMALLNKHCGQITEETMMSVLRDHGEGEEGRRFSPARSSMASICMHAANNLTRASQSTGALVARLGAAVQTYWVTGTSGTCTGLFKPLYLQGRPLPSHGPQASGTFDQASLWWAHERLHRATLADYAPWHALYAAERDALERRFLAETRDLEDAALEDRAEARAAQSQRCFDEARRAMTTWVERVSTASAVRNRLPWLYRRYWNQQAQQAGFSDRL